MSKKITLVTSSFLDALYVDNELVEDITTVFSEDDRKEFLNEILEQYGVSIEDIERLEISKKYIEDYLVWDGFIDKKLDKFLEKNNK